MPSSGMNGITSVAPMRGCTPLCCVRSMSSAALPAARMAASATASGLPTSVITERLWSASLVRSITQTSGTALMASTSASTFVRSRPSEKFGTHSIRRFMGLGDWRRVDGSDEVSAALREIRPFYGGLHTVDHIVMIREDFSAAQMETHEALLLVNCDERHGTAKINCAHGESCGNV